MILLNSCWCSGNKWCNSQRWSAKSAGKIHKEQITPEKLLADVNVLSHNISLYIYSERGELVGLFCTNLQQEESWQSREKKCENSKRRYDLLWCRRSRIIWFFDTHGNILLHIISTSDISNNIFSSVCNYCMTFHPVIL